MSTTTYAPTDDAIAHYIDEYQQFHHTLGGNVDVRVDGAGYDHDGGVVLVVFDTEYGQHLIITFAVDGTLTVAPVHTPNNKENQS